MSRILGIDPGLQITGYGVIEIGTAGVRVIEAGVVKPKGTDLADRVASLYDGLSEVIATLRPEAAAVEQLYAHYDHPRTAILMGHARGVVLLAAAKHGVRVSSYAATRIKKTITGHGHATKDQMQRAVQRELQLVTKPEPADVADALAAALTHYYAQKSVANSTSIIVKKARRPTTDKK
jgi:crossover junction endodeoxyribonuclease RuvC